MYTHEICILDMIELNMNKSEPIVSDIKLNLIDQLTITIYINNIH
jgi:hypothetical protein